MDARPTAAAGEIADELRNRFGLPRSALPGLRRHISAVIFGYRTVIGRVAVTAPDSGMLEAELRRRTIELNRLLRNMDQHPSFLPERFDSVGLVFVLSDMWTVFNNMSVVANY